MNRWVTAGSGTKVERGRGRWLVLATIAGTLVTAGCARSVAGDASPVAGAAISSTRTSDGRTPESRPPTSAAEESSTPSAPSVSTPTPTPTKTTPSKTPTATPPAIKWLIPAQSKVKSKINSFGNLEAGLGKPYEITWTKEKTTALRFVVDSATINGRCETPTKPVNGHFLILSVRVQLGDASADDLGNSRIGFTGEFWTAFNAKNVAEVGTTSTAAGDCITRTTGFPYSEDLAPGKVYSGKIALDVSSVKGTVVLMDSVGGGWIYHYG
ncbi:hypothetical protein ABIB25_003486 [Nakamurella sp. UYEF19]|uniref:hypothetical protein n=1 Tax=Nakamurella sp. UYEF19 TaxID=1756392 RepID=UPI0033979EEE